MSRSYSYKEALNFLNSFINYERVIKFPYKKSLKLERVKNLFQKLKINYKRLKAIHIAGTKGKGSTAVFLSFILARCGFKVGLFTSPHFEDFRERIKIVQSSKSKVQSKLIPKTDIVELLGEARPILERLRFHRKFGSLSFFEVYTALAFKYFLKEGVDFTVLECGLGGRLDATNVVRPLISIITPIGYDHTQQLGKTLKEIASEKAGIIKKNIPVVSVSQKDSVLKVLKDKTRRLNLKLYTYKKDFFSKDIRLAQKYTTFDFSSSLGEYRNLKIRLLGEHQVENACLAVFCFQLLKRKYKLKDESMYKALKEAFLEARFQVIRKKNKIFILDIAHNPLSIKALDKAIKVYFPSKRVILIFGCSKDKDAKTMLQNIDFESIIITKAENPRAEDPYIIKKAGNLRNCLIGKNPQDALRKAKKISDKDSLVVITGSLFLVAQIKPLISS